MLNVNASSCGCTSRLTALSNLAAALLLGTRSIQRNDHGGTIWQQIGDNVACGNPTRLQCTLLPGESSTPFAPNSIGRYAC